jgi:dienelactone hydrolase
MGAKRIGAVGYCFGGKYVIRFLAQGRGVDAGFVAHPSFAESAEVEAIANPLSIAASEEDQVFPAEKRRETEDILFKKDVPYQMSLYSDCQHGFAVRTDLKDRKKRFAKESAYFQAVRWFDEWVKELGTKGNR